MKEYTTIRNPAQDEFVERKSRFIGYIAPVKCEAEALEFITEIKTRHRDATHNTFAYTLRDGVKRCSDDGEPQGTAGVPILDCIEKEGLIDVAVVVTRYFGGILLGAGGLVRAYSHGAKIAVDAASRMTMSPCILCSMEYDYSFHGKIMNILPKYRMKIMDTDYGAVVRLTGLFIKEEYDRFQKELTELTSALVVPQVVEECFDEISEQR